MRFWIKSVHLYLSELKSMVECELFGDWHDTSTYPRFFTTLFDITKLSCFESKWYWEEHMNKRSGPQLFICKYLKKKCILCIYLGKERKIADGKPDRESDRKPKWRWWSWQMERKLGFFIVLCRICRQHHQYMEISLFVL